MSRPTNLVLLRPSLDDLPPRPRLPAGYRLRPAVDSDTDALAATLTAAFAETWSVDRIRRDLLDAEDVVATFVITHGGRAVATASNRWVPDRFPDAGYVHWVGTAPEHTRRGLAAALLIELLWQFAEQGRLTAVLETDDFRHPALRSYLRLGFTPVYEVRNEDHRPRWSAIFTALYA
jgi:mycothiol synthase